MLKRVFSKKNSPSIALVLIVLTSLYTLWYFHPWEKNDAGNRGVIKWDVISYYSYLPATVIHGDITLDFLNEGKIKNDNKFWTIKLENGNRLIVTSMGLSFLYAPFFFIAHALAPVLGQANDGFSNIYQFMLVVSGFFYSILGLILLMKFLRKHFDPVVTAITIFAIWLGSNLYYYSTVEAAMPHSHNFFLVTLFITLVIRWYRQSLWYNGLILGLMFGLIVLVRPTNILLFLFLLLYGVTSWKTLWGRIEFYLKKWYLVIIMFVAFLIPWIPQFIYWKAITGQYLYFTYAEKGASFYFAHPHILESLFHFRKGWLIYTPVMVFALTAIPFLSRWSRKWFWALAIYVVAMVYVQSSWWNWWFGGGYGLRAYISMYPLLAIPLAELLKKLSLKRSRLAFRMVASIIVVLVVYQVFQTRQYTTQAIHYSGTCKKSYFENFMRSHPTPESWKMLELPDFNLARLGIYVSYSTGEDKEAWRSMEREKAYEQISGEIEGDKKVQRQIKWYANREEIPLDSAMHMVVERMYSRKIK
ncbi:MAG: hypothetical protein ABFS38_06735 [Bacteroidota bacterium]